MASPSRLTLDPVTRNDRPRMDWCPTGRHYYIRDVRMGGYQHPHACGSADFLRFMRHRKPILLQAAGVTNPFAASNLTPSPFTGA